MKRILVIDDDPSRIPILEAFFGQKVDHVTSVPETFVGYDIVSFDNDLGGDLNVAQILWKWCWKDPEGLKAALKGVNEVFIHSTNSVAWVVIQGIMKDCGVKASWVPFTTMKVME